MKITQCNNSLDTIFMEVPLVFSNAI